MAREKKEVPVISPSAMTQPGLDNPKQTGKPVGRMPRTGIQSDTIKRVKTPKAATVGMAKPAAAPVAADAPQESRGMQGRKALDRSGRDVMGIKTQDWQKMLKKYGIPTE